MKAFVEKDMQEREENRKKFYEMYPPEQIEEMRKAFRERIARKSNSGDYCRTKRTSLCREAIKV